MSDTIVHPVRKKKKNLVSIFKIDGFFDSLLLKGTAFLTTTNEIQMFQNIK
jgi:hypothetical protein